MTPFSFLQELKNNGVDLWIEDDALQYQGPANALTPEIIITLKKMKPTLMQILQNDSCNNCQQHEELPQHGYGCVHKINDNYQYQWSPLDTLEQCPLSYWN